MLLVHLFQAGFSLAFILVASPADSLVQINQGLTVYLISIFILIIIIYFACLLLYKLMTAAPKEISVCCKVKGWSFGLIG